MRPSLLLFLVLLSPPAPAESQRNYDRGIQDPFGDVGEPAGREELHLDRDVLVGVDAGVGIFTGGLGSSATAAFYGGAKLVYFFDRCVGVEAAAHYAKHLDQVGTTTARFAEIDTTLVPITAALRYTFDVRRAPKAIAVVNPYLVGGGGLYLRWQNVTRTAGAVTAPASADTSFGVFAGGGAEVALIAGDLYLGVDLRFHLVFFPDEDATLGGVVAAGERAGDYFTPTATLTYAF